MWAEKKVNWAQRLTPTSCQEFSCIIEKITNTRAKFQKVGGGINVGPTTTSGLNTITFTPFPSLLILDWHLTSELTLVWHAYLVIYIPLYGFCGFSKCTKLFIIEIFI